MNTTTAATPAASTCRCPLCGVTVTREKRAGRPRDYCSDACREASKLISRLTSHLDIVRGRGLAEDGERFLRRRLWSLVNSTLNKRRATPAAGPSTVDGPGFGSEAASA